MHRTTSHKATHGPSSSTVPITPLARLRQIAEELRRAAELNNIEVVTAAASLLAPTVELCRLTFERDGGQNGASAEAAMQIHAILEECEGLLTVTLRGVSVELRRIRQGKRSAGFARRPSASALRLAG